MTAVCPSDQTVSDRCQNNTYRKIFHYTRWKKKKLDFLSKLSLLAKVFFTSDKCGDHVSFLSTVTPSKRDFSIHVIKEPPLEKGAIGPI